MSSTEKIDVGRDDLKEINEFLSDVFMEVVRARKLFPSSEAVLTALTEEVGELSKAYLDESLKNVRMEAIQVAAMAVRVALEGDPTLTGVRVRRGANTKCVICGRRNVDDITVEDTCSHCMDLR